MKISPIKLQKTLDRYFCKTDAECWIGLLTLWLFSTCAVVAIPLNHCPVIVTCGHRGSYLSKIIGLTSLCTISHNRDVLLQTGPIEVSCKEMSNCQQTLLAGPCCHHLQWGDWSPPPRSRALQSNLSEAYSDQTCLIFTIKNHWESGPVSNSKIMSVNTSYYRINLVRPALNRETPWDSQERRIRPEICSRT